MDYTGIDYDYSDDLCVVQGVPLVDFGGSVALSGFDDAAADDRLVFTNIDNPKGAAQLFRDEATITPTNDGLGPAAITGLTFSGTDADDFEIVGASPASIPEGGSAQVTVRFTGSDSADENKAVLTKGTLTVETDPGLAPKVVQLTGLAQIGPSRARSPPSRRSRRPSATPRTWPRAISWAAARSRRSATRCCCPASIGLTPPSGWR